MQKDLDPIRLFPISSDRDPSDNSDTSDPQQTQRSGRSLPIGVSSAFQVAAPPCSRIRLAALPLFWGSVDRTELGTWNLGNYA